MEIIVGERIDSVKFGLLENEVVNLFGVPNKKYTDDFGDVNLQYFNRQISLKFEKEQEYRLGWIEVYNKNAKLFNVSPWNKTKTELIEEISSILNENPEIEDYGSFESITFNNSWLELQFEMGKLKCINFGVLFDKNDKPQYPNA
jgi:hypothetical protein